MSPCRSRRTKKLMGVPEQRYHAWMSVQLLIIVVIRRFDHGVLLIIRSQSDDRGRKLLLITRVLSLDEFSVPLLLATLSHGGDVDVVVACDRAQALILEGHKAQREADEDR